MKYNEKYRVEILNRKTNEEIGSINCKVFVILRKN